MFATTNRKLILRKNLPGPLNSFLLTLLKKAMKMITDKVTMRYTGDFDDDVMLVKKEIISKTT